MVNKLLFKTNKKKFFLKKSKKKQNMLKRRGGGFRDKIQEHALPIIGLLGMSALGTTAYAYYHGKNSSIHNSRRIIDNQIKINESQINEKDKQINQKEEQIIQKEEQIIKLHTEIKQEKNKQLLIQYKEKYLKISSKYYFDNELLINEIFELDNKIFKIMNDHIDDIQYREKNFTKLAKLYSRLNKQNEQFGIKISNMISSLEKLDLEDEISLEYLKNEKKKYELFKKNIEVTHKYIIALIDDNYPEIEEIRNKQIAITLESDKIISNSSDNK